MTGDSFESLWGRLKVGVQEFLIPLIRSPKTEAFEQVTPLEVVHVSIGFNLFADTFPGSFKHVLLRFSVFVGVFDGGAEFVVSEGFQCE